MTFIGAYLSVVRNPRCIRFKIASTRSGVRTHADICPLDLKSNALTTRPSWLAIRRQGSSSAIESELLRNSPANCLPFPSRLAIGSEILCALLVKPVYVAVMAEWLRRWTRNPMGYSRTGSNPVHSVSLIFFTFKKCLWLAMMSHENLS